MPSTLLDSPRALEAIRIECPRCNGSGRAIVEYEASGAPAKVYICSTCLGQRWLLVNAPRPS